jgi:Co/Zn/Cd efflux system component
MLFSSSTDVYSSLSAIIDTTLSGFWGFIIFIIGTVLSFFVIQLILKTAYPKSYKHIDFTTEQLINEYDPDAIQQWEVIKKPHLKNYGDYSTWYGTDLKIHTIDKESKEI